ALHTYVRSRRRGISLAKRLDRAGVAKMRRRDARQPLPRHGSTDQVALGLMAPRLGQPFELRCRFDAFCEGATAKFGSKSDDCPDDGFASSIAAKSLDKSLVDFHNVRRQVL